jgi:hypothetical protein
MIRVPNSTDASGGPMAISPQHFELEPPVLEIFSDYV